MLIFVAKFSDFAGYSKSLFFPSAFYMPYSMSIWRCIHPYNCSLSLLLWIKFPFSLGPLQWKILLLVWSIGYLGELGNIFFSLMMMRENHHCCSAWLKIMVIFISCKVMMPYVSLWLFSFANTFFRSALRAFRRWVAYANADCDRILIIWNVWFLM